MGSRMATRTPRGMLSGLRASIRRFPTTTIACSRGSFRQCWHASSLLTARPPLSIGRNCTTGTKAPLSAPKKLMAGKPVAGAAVRLFPVAACLCIAEEIAEGIETALAAAQLYGAPVWSCISAAGIQSFEPPEGTRELIIFGDNDTNFVGQTAAYAAANRLKRRAFVVTVKTPSTAGDWLDQLNEGG
jgi:hypothetical protein